MEGVASLIFWILIVAGGCTLYVRLRMRQAAERRRVEAEAAERRRVEECGDVVMFYANNFGYIARQCISRDELEILIDDGVSPEELSEEIADRIDETEGMIL